VLEAKETQAAARALGLEVTPLEIRRAADVAPAFQALKGQASFRKKRTSKNVR
jgi:ABC-type uncharacterized transport system substrate-binding protein